MSISLSFFYYRQAKYYDILYSLECAFTALVICRVIYCFVPEQRFSVHSQTMFTRCRLVLSQIIIASYNQPRPQSNFKKCFLSSSCIEKILQERGCHYYLSTQPVEFSGVNCPSVTTTDQPQRSRNILHIVKYN